MNINKYLIALTFIFTFSLPVLSKTKTLFIDNFNDESKIDFKTNIMIISNYVRMSNIVGMAKAEIVSKLISKQTNEIWKELKLTYKVPAPWNNPNLTIKILDKNNKVLENKEYTTPSSKQNTTINLADSI